jgi:hypothetical protein
MYKHSKSPVIRIGGWVIMGFLTLVIVISFGMPDFLSRMNMDQNVAALVNGEQIQRVELARYLKLSKDNGDDGQKIDAKRNEILNQLIRKKLQVQYAKANGIRVTDENVTATIRKIFSDESGKFSEFYFKRTLENQMMSTSAFFSEVKNEIAVNETSRLLYNCGVGVSKEELSFRTAVEGSKFQTRFAFVSNDDLRKRLGGAIVVTDKEVDDEMAKNKKDIKDPATDRERFKKRVADRKLEDAKKEIVKSVDDLAAKDGSFDAAAALLGGKVAMSDMFKAGEPVREPGKDSKPLYSLSESEIFRNDFSAIKPGVSSRAILGHDGIYVFTPVKKEITFAAADPADDKAADQSRRELSYYVESAVYKPYFEKARIVRNLKEKEAE